ncbi:hypothetical protein NDU88_003822 [Pleurodeles waltl]|uniref:Uncharacterized protein n=1 Tax=Pleurodeles waltl TaxID=8319 RepID=A0AAV7LMN1_PLEWA|nr:hypothetical protein NDU88_003822 [Pleurodeles waltl]
MYGGVALGEVGPPVSWEREELEPLCSDPLSFMSTSLLVSDNGSANALVSLTIFAWAAATCDFVGRAVARAPAAGRRGPPIRPRPPKTQAGHTRVDGAARLPPHGDRVGRGHRGPALSGQLALTLRVHSTGHSSAGYNRVGSSRSCSPTVDWRAPIDAGASVYHWSASAAHSVHATRAHPAHTTPSGRRPSRVRSPEPRAGRTQANGPSSSPRGDRANQRAGTRAQQAARAHLLLRVRSPGPSSADRRQINPARPCLHADGLDSPYVCRGLCVLLVSQSSQGTGFWQIFGGP